MKITMISNYMNHHQIPFSEALYKELGNDYRFIQTEPMEEERLQMGWGIRLEEYPYVLLLERSEALCRQLIEESEVLLIGWNEREDLFENRLKSNKLTLRISERIYREGQWKAISPRGLLRKYKEHIRYRNNSVYLLCAGGYVASDFSLIRAYPDKMFQFGYFPEFIEFSEEEMRAKRDWGKVAGEKEIQIVWAGRLIPLKHPEYVITLAESLKKKGYSFHVHLIGGGEMEEKLKAMTEKKGLQSRITFYGFQRPACVRRIMDKCHIHLFTSNHLEGWGAVVNEGMNSGCAEVVNSEVGAACFLIRHGENGLLYRNGSYEDMERNVLYLMQNPAYGSLLGQKAYQTIATQWNASVAASRLLDFYEQWKRGEITPPGEGPFSRARAIAPGKMYQYLIKER